MEWRVACVRIPRFPIGAVWRHVDGLCDRLVDGLGSFTGTRRRMERKGEAGGVRVARTPSQVAELAKLPPVDVLRAQLLGAITAT